jgi:hypothetical protein
MDEFDELQDAVGGNARERKAKRRQMSVSKAKPIPAPMRDAERRTALAPEAPAPRLQEVIGNQGYEATERALGAWNARIQGTPIVDVAHELGISIDLCKKLIKDVNQAIHEDLKENIDLNRQLDLQRIDGLLQTYYPQARQGDTDSAAVVIRALQHRSKLTGVEPLPDPGRSHPTNVLMWINAQMPNINKLVDSLPLEMPPSAP